MTGDVTWAGGPPLVVSALRRAVTDAQEVMDQPDGSGSDVQVVVHLGPGLPPEVAALDGEVAGRAVVWVAGDVNGHQIAAALSHGCMSVVPQDVAVDDLGTAISEAAQGRSWLPQSVVVAVSSAIRRPSPAPDKRLTSRETEVLELLRLGRTTKEIADHLVVSTHTASNHIRHILTKLEVHSRLKAVAVAYELGLVDAP